MVADISSNTLPSSIYYFYVYAIPDKLLFKQKFISDCKMYKFDDCC